MKTIENKEKAKFIDYCRFMVKFQ